MLTAYNMSQWNPLYSLLGIRPLCQPGTKTRRVNGRTSTHELQLDYRPDGSVWSRHGVEQQTWNYLQEDGPTDRQFSFLSEEDVKVILDLTYSDLYVTSDLKLSWGSDDSVNPSALRVLYFEKGDQADIEVSVSGTTKSRITLYIRHSLWAIFQEKESRGQVWHIRFFGLTV